MATDLELLIFDQELGAVVCNRWLGGNGTWDAARNVLTRQPRTLLRGWECWVPVAPAEVRTIAIARYEDGATPEEVSRLSDRFPSSRYVWMIIRDF